VTVLFAPSEGKRPGGDLPPIDESAFCLPELYGYRLEAVTRYDEYVEQADEARHALIEKAAQTFDPAERNDLLVQTMDIAMPVDVAYIPLHYENVIAGVAKGIDFSPRPDEYLHAFEAKKK